MGSKVAAVVWDNPVALAVAVDKVKVRLKMRSIVVTVLGMEAPEAMEAKAEPVDSEDRAAMAAQWCSLPKMKNLI